VIGRGCTLVTVWCGIWRPFRKAFQPRWLEAELLRGKVLQTLPYTRSCSCFVVLVRACIELRDLTGLHMAARDNWTLFVTSATFMT
jgi:hypothetical protein